MADIKRIPKHRRLAPKVEEPTGTKIVLHLDDDTIANVDKFNKGGDTTREDFIKGLIAITLAEMEIAELEG